MPARDRAPRGSCRCSIVSRAAEPGQRETAETALVLPLQRDLDRLDNMLSAEPVTLKTLPAEIARDWVTPDGRARIEILPKADPNDSEAMRRFAQAVVKYRRRRPVRRSSSTSPSAR